MTKLNEKRLINDVRCLALDMIHEAGSGHPGIALGAAPLLYTLFTYHLNIDLNKSNWCNRDRFVLSCGHASSLLYALEFFADESKYNLNDLKNYRNIYSKTPGHPEYNLENKIDVTTGPLGEGVATAVGMAMAGKYLERYYSDKKSSLFDYYVYAMVSDGDLMEGVSYEAACLAAQYQLDNLILLYDCNGVSLDGEIDENYIDSIANVYADIGFATVSYTHLEPTRPG